jgi:hypothetical protein
MEKEEVFTTWDIKVSREDDVESLNKDNVKNRESLPTLTRNVIN